MVSIYCEFRAIESIHLCFFFRRCNKFTKCSTLLTVSGKFSFGGVFVQRWSHLQLGQLQNARQPRQINNKKTLFNDKHKMHLHLFSSIVLVQLLEIQRYFPQNIFVIFCVFVCVLILFILLSMQSFVGISLLKSKIDAAQTQIQTLFASTLQLCFFLLDKSSLCLCVCFCELHSLNVDQLVYNYS